MDVCVTQSAQILAEHTLCLSPENEEIKVKTALLLTWKYTKSYIISFINSTHNSMSPEPTVIETTGINSLPIPNIHNQHEKEWESIL